MKLLLATLVFFSMPLGVQGTCLPRDVLLDHLERNYAERPVAFGLMTNGSVLEIIVSESGSWTVIVSTPNGMSCNMASGRYWTEVLPEGTRA